MSDPVAQDARRTTVIGKVNLFIRMFRFYYIGVHCVRRNFRPFPYYAPQDIMVVPFVFRDG